MPMTLSGDGTITGLAVGGLPNATVVQADLATGVAGTGPAFSAYASTATNTANATLTKLVFATEEFDTNNNFANSTFTPTVAGYYQINASVFYGANTQIISIYKNGVEYKRGSQLLGATNGFSTISSLVQMNGSTDYIEIYWYQNSGVTVNSGVGQIYTWVNGFLARAA